MPFRLLYVVDHPIQYQAPLLRRIAALDDIALRVAFGHLGGAEAYADAGFGRTVRWDVDVLGGYDSAVTDDIGDCDAVWMHGWQGRRMRRVLAAARRRGVPVLMRGENTLAAMPDDAGVRGILKRRYLGWIFARCAAFLAIGADNRDYYRAHGIAEDRLFDMPYAVDNAFFRDAAIAAAPRRDALRAALGLDPGRPVVLFAGKLQRRKNPHVLEAAFRALDPATCRRPYLVFVGDGEMRGDLRADADVRLLGFRNQTELPAFYDLADVFVLASHREPWGLAVNEAMNGGCAVIVSDACGCARDLVAPDCGRVVRAGDARALAAALTDTLADADACAAMGRAARERVGGWDFARDVDGLRRAIAFVSRRDRPA